MISKLKKKFSQPQDAFVLVELVVAVLIIGVLASVTSISILKSQKTSRDTQRKSDLSSIEKSLEAFYSTNHKYPASSVDECKPLSDGRGGFIDSPGCSESCASSWDFDMTTGTNKPELWIGGLKGYADKLPNDPKGNNNASPSKAPIFNGMENNYLYAYYSKSCTEILVNNTDCPYCKNGACNSGQQKSYVAGSFYILATTLENKSDPDAVGKNDMYYTDCSGMKGNSNFNQDAFAKIKVF